ncbi:MAG TPA: P1 family peptidase, partial [bacterium]|nr:P1 family peptidase [bacterium]
MPRVNEFLVIGRLPTGTHSAITDVPGVLVGHASIDQGRVHTGVTA